MRINNKLREKFGIELSSKEKSILKQLIMFFFIILIISLICVAIIGTYYAVDKFVKPIILKDS